MGKMLNFFRSYYEISVSKKAGQKALHFLVAQNIPFFGLEDDDEILRFCLYPAYFKEYRMIRAKERYEGETRRCRGLRDVLYRYRKRTGFAAGALLAIGILIISSFFVWDITITGTETIPEKSVIEALERHGVKLGAYIPSLNTDKIEKEIVLEVDGLSWISLNLRGTVAAVEIRERNANTQPVDLQSPSNLVATFDGQIESLEITGGVAAVKRGQIVKKGDLLVSGVIDSNALGYRLVRARGEVTARVTLTYDIEIPYQRMEKVYTGEFKKQKTIKIFSKSIKLFKKDSIPAENCDKIEKERRLYLFGKIKLPIFITETTYAFYEEQEKMLTENEALKLAYEELRAQSGSDLEEAEILARHTHISDSGTGLLLHEDVECILDITHEVKIETS